MTVQPIQPQDRRPSAKTAARRQARKQQEMNADAVGIRIDGVDYVINPHDLTGRVEMEIRREIGMGLAELTERLQASPGLDYLAMFMWAVRHTNGDDVTLDEILDDIRADSDVEVLSETGSGPKA